MMGEEKGMHYGMKCGCKHHKVVPLMITVIALDFILGRLGTFSMDTVSTIWPIALLIIGLTKLTAHKCKCC